MHLLLLAALSPAFSQIISPPSEAFGDQLVIGHVGNPPDYFNPYGIDDIFNQQITRLIFGNGLIQNADRFNQPPPLVDRFIFPGSNKTQGYIWKYVLSRNINYQNGISLRNSDVQFTYNMLNIWGGHILNRKIDFSNIKSIDISGDLEVQFTLKKKDENFDQYLSDIPILSQIYYQNVLENGFDFLKSVRPLGYGPFRFERNFHNEIVLSSHPHYVMGRPFLDRIVFKYFDDEQQMVDNFIQGGVDMIELNDRISAQRLHQILRDDIKIFATLRPEKKIYYLLFNVNRYPFQNLRVRTAIRGAINPNEILSRLIDQNGHLAYSMIDYTDPLFYKELFRDNYQPGLSLKILNENGWEVNQSKGILEKDGKGLSFELLFEQNSFLEESIARAIKIHLAELGINVEPRPVSHFEKQSLVRQNKFTAVLGDFSYFDKDMLSAVKLYYNSVLKKQAPYINYNNPFIEKLFKQADADPGLLKPIVQRYQIFLHQDAPVVFLYFDDTIIYAVRNRFKNVRVSSTSGKSYYHRLSPFENWFVPKPLQKYSSW